MSCHATKLNLFITTGGVYYFIKCMGMNSRRRSHNVYLQVNSINELVAVEKQEDASDFEIVQGSKENTFAIKYGSQYLPKSQKKKLDGPLMMQNGETSYFTLKNDNPNVSCTVEEFKRGAEQFYLKIGETCLMLKRSRNNQDLVTLLRVQWWNPGPDSYCSFKLEKYYFN